jgi:cell division transport system permease protein
VKLSLITFVFRQVRSSLRHLAWSHILTSMTMALTLFVFGAFMMLQANLEQLLTAWGDQIHITAYLGRALEPAELDRLLKSVETLPGVERVRYTSQTQAWNEFQSVLGAQSGLLEGLPHDVLPASLEISIKRGQRDSSTVERLAQQLREKSEVASVEYPQEWVERLALIVLALAWVKWLVAGVFFLATFFIVGNTVKLAIYARRDEVEIMQLVGASETLIKAPFVLEGMLQGVAGGALALAALWAGYVLLREQIEVFAGALWSDGHVRFLNLEAAFFLVAIGLVLGAGGSLVSLRRIVKTWRGLQVPV